MAENKYIRKFAGSSKEQCKRWLSVYEDDIRHYDNIIAQALQAKLNKTDTKQRISALKTILKKL